VSMATANLFKATALWHLGERDAALEQVLLCRQRTSETDLQAKAARKAAEFLFAMGRDREAYEMLVESAALSDTLARRKFGKEIATAQIRFDTATKDRQITEQEQALKLGLEEHRRRSLQRNIAIGGALALVVLSMLLWRALQSRRKLAKQEEELHEKRVDELMHEHEIDAIDRMLEGQEKERDRVAKDLHDQLGSMLSAIKHQLGAVESEVAEVRQDHVTQYSKLHSMLDEAVGEVRRISHDMITVTVSRFGLEKALEDLCDSVRVKGKLDVELRHFGIERRMQRSVEIAVYRIVQEAISNMLKHADATELSVDVTRGPGHISVIVHDNGKGFEPQALSMGIGLGNMRQRAAAIGAVLRVESTPGNGTTVSVEGPVVE
ncbi:MAG: sensor histidine kinase, partial [Flavobacteriales bacterium]